MARRGRGELWRAAEVFGLGGLAVAQPLYSVFGASPEVFVFVGATSRDIVAFALILLVVPPLLLWGGGALLGLVWPRARQPAHLAALTLLAALLAIYTAKHLGWPPGPTLLPLGLLGAAAMIIAYRKMPATVTVLHYLALGPVVYLAAFLALSPAGELLRPSNAEAADIDITNEADLPPVVMIVFDEWPLTSIVDRDGTIDAELYPNLADLGGDSTWYRNTTTVANSTLFAVPSILTGRMPVQGESADARSQPENLFTMLGGPYQLEAVEPVTRLCPASLCRDPERFNDDGTTSSGFGESSLGRLLTDAGDVYRTIVGPGEIGSSSTFDEAAGEAPPSVEQQVAGARSDDRETDLGNIFQARPPGLNGLLDTFSADEAPTVHFLHILLPHSPYARVPTGEHYVADDELEDVALVDGQAGGNLRGPAARAAQFDRQRMVLQTGYLDTLVGDLVRTLRQTGLYDDALIVLTADHGIAFEAGAPVRGLGPDPLPDATMPDMAWVPLLIKAPDQAEPEVDDRNALTIDVMPTIADLLDIDLPWPVDGRSLADAPRESTRKPFVRAVGSTSANYQLEPPVDITEQAQLADVFAGGIDTFLRPGVSVDRWYALGPRPDLLGRRVADLPVGRGSLSADLETGATIIVEPGGDLPAVATARLAGPVPDGTRVAVAVDGTIAAVAPTYTDPDGPGRLATFLLRSTLTEGTHTVTLYAVGRGAAPGLGPIDLT